MCQTSVITNRVERLSKRSYSHRLDVATPNRYHVTQLVRLNRELDSLYEFIYDDWRTITEEDYKMFGGQFVISDIVNFCIKMPKNEEMKKVLQHFSP